MECSKCGKSIENGIIAIMKGVQKPPICWKCYKAYLEDNVHEAYVFAVMRWLDL